MAVHRRFEPLRLADRRGFRQPQHNVDTARCIAQAWQTLWKLEHALGCDLVYYARDYDAYVLVQYKRLRQEKSDWVFRPDKRFDSELTRMREIAAPVFDHAQHVENVGEAIGVLDDLLQQLCGLLVLAPVVMLAPDQEKLPKVLVHDAKSPRKRPVEESI